MAKFLVTSGSYFQPFTYDELAKPLVQMAEAQNAAQDMYDNISMETSALEQYISENPDDSDARALYNSYKTKLNNLQENLWGYGYTPQTRRDLSVAKQGFFGEMGKLKGAIQRRMEESKAYNEVKRKDRDAVMGRDPGTLGLNGYLRDQNYGKDWYSYSGKEFEAGVATEMQARAQELLASKVIKDPRLVDQLTRIMTHGVSNSDLAEASPVLDALLNATPEERAAYYKEEKTTAPVQMLVETLLNRYDAVGARTADLSDSERNRLIGYGKAGWSHGIGKPEVKDFTDPVYEEQREFRKMEKQHELNKALEDYKDSLKNGGGAGGNGNGSQSDPFAFRNQFMRHEVVEENHAAKKKEVEDFIGANNTNIYFDSDKSEIRTNAQAAERVYSGKLRREMYTQLGFDIGRDPSREIIPGVDATTPRSRFLRGQVNIGGRTLYTEYNPNQKYIDANGNQQTGAVLVSDKPGEKGKVNIKMSDSYHFARDVYERQLDSYKHGSEMRKEIYNLAKKANPDAQYEQYRKDDIDFSVPLEEYESKVMSLPGNRYLVRDDAYVAEQGTDKGEYINRLMDKFSSNFTIEMDSKKNEKGTLILGGEEYIGRKHNGQNSGIHELLPGGNMNVKAVTDMNDIFTFKDGKINNVQYVRLSQDAIANEYLIVKTTKSANEITIPIVYFRDLGLKGDFDYAQANLAAILNDNVLSVEAKALNIKYLQDSLASKIMSRVGYKENTASPSGTSKEDLN